MKSIYLLLVSFILVPLSANAELVYTFDQVNYNVEINATVDVKISLTQSNPTTLLTDQGLFSSGVRVVFDSPPSLTDRSQVLSLDDILPNPSFDDSDPFLTGTEVVTNESAGLFDATSFGSSFVRGNSILIGTFTFTAGSVAGEVTNLRAEDFSSFAETISGEGITLDGQINPGFATITTVAAVPEPSSIAFIFCTMAFAWRRRYVKSKQAK